MLIFATSGFPYCYGRAVLHDLKKVPVPSAYNFTPYLDGMILFFYCENKRRANLHAVNGPISDRTFC